MTLLPCPFCGTQAIAYFDHQDNIATCPNEDCPAMPGAVGNKTMQAAIDKWNTRATLPEALTPLPSNGCISLNYDKMKKALTELLRLYDWRNELGRIERDFNHDKKQMTTRLNQYGREKKVAWHVARDTLAGAPDIDVLMLHERIQAEAQARLSPQREPKMDPADYSDFGSGEPQHSSPKGSE